MLRIPLTGKVMSKLIEVKNLSYTIPYGKTILKEISFDLDQGEFLGVLGRNGVGKTTLMDLLLGERPLTTGMIKVLDEGPLSFDRKKMNSVFFLSQDIFLKGNLTIDKYLKFISSFYPKYSQEEERFLLDFFSLHRDEKIGGLSTGQQKKVAIVAALSSLPQVLLVDEITAVLDPETRGQFFHAVNRARQEHGMGIVLATNIAEDLITRASHILFINDGIGNVCSPDEINELFNLGKIA